MERAMVRWTDFRQSISQLTRAGLVAVIFGGPSSVTAREATSQVRSYYNFLFYASVGDVERALAEFADDAVVVVRPMCPLERPCRGKDAIRERYIKPMTRDRGSLPLPEGYDGERLQASGTSRTHRVPDRQLFEIRDGRIVSVRAKGVGDTASTLTARRDQGADD